jgi:D-amino peptidase
MKVYISVDMEGVACVVNREDIVPTGNGYQMARKWMTAETNAAVLGALEAGATEVVVSDSHNDMRNLLPDELHEDVLLVRGTPRPLGQMEGLDESFDAVFLIGYHSMAGHVRGLISHTFLMSMIHAVRFNGVTFGETEISAALAGHLGVPVALVSGDDTLAAHVGAVLPWSERVTTKWAINTTAAKSLTPSASQKRILEAAKRALDRLDEMKPWSLETPVHFELDYMQPMYAYLGADIPGVEMIGGRTLAYTGADLLDVFRIWRLMMNAALAQVQV